MTPDLIIALLYCLLIPVIGVIAARKASKGLDAYFLGNRRFGPLLMGVSGMTDWFDLSGTMLITSLLFIMGPRGLFVEFRGGAVLILAFLMLWTGKWHRRSGCMTAAEWISFRFGEGRSAEILRTVISIFNVMIGVGMLAYIIRGSMLFFGVIFPWPPIIVTSLVTGAAVLYTVASGFYGVTIANLIHGAVILAACIGVGVAGWLAVGESGFNSSVAGGVTGAQDWMSYLPSINVEGIPCAYEGFRFLAGFTALCLLRVFIGSMGAGAEPRYFAAKDDRSCGLQTLLQGGMIVFRWPMMMGFAVLGVLWLKNNPGYIKEGAGIAGFAEEVIPVVLQSVFSPLLRGLVLAALLGAMMSTLACTLNSTAATVVKDIYQHRLRPKAGRWELMGASYIASALIALAGFIAGIGAPDLNRLWGWLAMGLMMGNCGPMFLRLYWWRCNATGAAIGIICGTAGVFIYRSLGEAWGNEWPFIIATVASFGGTIIGSLLTKPVPEDITTEFFKKTRPFGLWGKYSHLLSPDDQKEHRRDIAALPFVMLTQVCLYLCSMQVVLRNTVGATLTGAVAIAAGFCVWRIWGRWALVEKR